MGPLWLPQDRGSDKAWAPSCRGVHGRRRRAFKPVCDDRAGKPDWSGGPRAGKTEPVLHQRQARGIPKVNNRLLQGCNAPKTVYVGTCVPVS